MKILFDREKSRTRVVWQLLLSFALAGTVVIVGVIGSNRVQNNPSNARPASGPPGPGAFDSDAIVAREGTSPSGEKWEIRYSEKNGEECLFLYVDETVRDGGCGFGISEESPVGFSSGLREGEGTYYLYGLTSARVTEVVAESRGTESRVKTEPLQRFDGPALRSFVMIREPIDDVTKLVAYDSDGEILKKYDLDF